MASKRKTKRQSKPAKRSSPKTSKRAQKPSQRAAKKAKRSAKKVKKTAQHKRSKTVKKTARKGKKAAAHKKTVAQRIKEAVSKAVGKEREKAAVELEKERARKPTFDELLEQTFGIVANPIKFVKDHIANLPRDPTLHRGADGEWVSTLRRDEKGRYFSLESYLRKLAKVSGIGIDAVWHHFSSPSWAG